MQKDISKIKCQFEGCPETKGPVFMLYKGEGKDIQHLGFYKLCDRHYTELEKQNNPNYNKHDRALAV